MLAGTRSSEKTPARSRRHQARLPLHRRKRWSPLLQAGAPRPDAEQLVPPPHRRRRQAAAAAPSAPLHDSAGRRPAPKPAQAPRRRSVTAAPRRRWLTRASHGAAGARSACKLGRRTTMLIPQITSSAVSPGSAAPNVLASPSAVADTRRRASATRVGHAVAAAALRLRWGRPRCLLAAARDQWVRRRDRARQPSRAQPPPAAPIRRGARQEAQTTPAPKSKRPPCARDTGAAVCRARVVLAADHGGPGPFAAGERACGAPRPASAPAYADQTVAARQRRRASGTPALRAPRPSHAHLSRRCAVERTQRTRSSRYSLASSAVTYALRGSLNSVRSASVAASAPAGVLRRRLLGCRTSLKER